MFLTTRPVHSNRTNCRPRPFHRPNRGFTLIEVLVVVAIIALLISILLPSLSRARDEAKNAVCQSNVRQLGMGMGLFAFDHKGYYPEKDKWLTSPSWAAAPFDKQLDYADWAAYAAPKASRPSPKLPGGRQEGLIYRYVKNPQAFVCPMDNGYRTYADSQLGNQAQPVGHTNFAMNGLFEDLVGNRYKGYQLGAPDNGVSPIVDASIFPPGDPRQDTYFNDGILADSPSTLMLMMEESELSPCNDGHVNWEGYWEQTPYDQPMDKLTSRHHDRGNVAMFDGHIEGVSAKKDFNAATVHASNRAGRLYGAVYPGTGQNSGKWVMRTRVSKESATGPTHGPIGQ